MTAGRSHTKAKWRTDQQRRQWLTVDRRNTNTHPPKQKQHRLLAPPEVMQSTAVLHQVSSATEARMRQQYFP